MASAEAGPSNAPAEAAEAPAEGTAESGPPAPQMQELENVTLKTLEEAEAHLQDLISRKKYVDRLLVNLEGSIYAFEGSYLEETAGTGNIIKGFDGYLTNRNAPGAVRQKAKVNEADRLFSQSSTTYLKASSLQYPCALEIKEKERHIDPMRDHARPRPIPQEILRQEQLAASLKKKKRPTDFGADLAPKRR
ncbi:histone acetyltransferase subunit NuA4-domain-containing protein [Hyaloraphidium curvatum]|nr:histone acetyltransferase subunit NuA4-domain-containing protein [Hyaloraphidium curvatum]